MIDQFIEIEDSELILNPSIQVLFRFLWMYQNINWNSMSEDRNKEQAKPSCMDLENGPLEERECRDVICLAIFILNIAAMVYCSIYAYSFGNLSSVFRGTDSTLNICGKGLTADYPYLYFTNPVSANMSKRVCVKACPSYGASPTLPVIDCFTNTDIGSCNYDNILSSHGDTVNPSAPGSGGFDILGYDSYPVIDRLCLPSTGTFIYMAGIQNSSITAFNSIFSQQYLVNFVTDIKNNWQLFLAGIGIVIILSFFIMYLMRCVAGVVVWASIGVTLLAIICLGLLFLYSGGVFGTTDQVIMGYKIPTIGENVKYIRYYGYTVLGLGGVFLLIVLCLCNRIRLAVALCGCAGKYIVDVMTSVLVPIVMSLLATGLWAVCLFCMLMILSVAKFVAQTSNIFTTFESFTDSALIRFYYFFFGTLWCNAVLGAIATFLIASSACMWYYSHGPGMDLHLPILRSLARVFRYHLGSIVFGSFIIAVIQFLQFVVEIIKQQVSKVGADRNKAVECALNCAQCCLVCLQKIVSFLNKNAYIQIALRGKNFCAASKDGFQIIWSNPVRFSVVGGVGSIIIFIAKILISLINTIIMWSIFYFSKWGTMTSPFFPLLAVFLYSWMIASLFMNVYELAMDTLLVCFIVDETNQKENGKNAPKYAPEELLSLMDS